MPGRGPATFIFDPDRPAHIDPLGDRGPRGQGAKTDCSLALKGSGERAVKADDGLKATSVEVRFGSTCDEPIGGEMHGTARLIHKLTLI